MVVTDSIAGGEDPDKTKEKMNAGLALNGAFAGIYLIFLNKLGVLNADQ